MTRANSELRLRRSARIIVLNAERLALMFRFDIPEREPFWVTAGGECEKDETYEEAARRELLEETGIVADPGPQIARTTPQFVTPEGELVQADERYFVVHTEVTEIDTKRHTALERSLMTRHRWFRIAELADWPEAVYPENLAELIAKETDS